MNTLYKDLIYLFSCTVNGITPGNATMQAMDLEKLYRLGCNMDISASKIAYECMK